MNDIPLVEDLLTISILLYDINIVDGDIIGKIARRSVQKYNITVRYVMWATLIQSFNLFVALIGTLSSAEHSTWVEI